MHRRIARHILKFRVCDVKTNKNVSLFFGFKKIRRKIASIIVFRSLIFIYAPNFFFTLSIKREFILKTLKHFFSIHIEKEYKNLFVKI